MIYIIYLVLFVLVICQIYIIWQLDQIKKYYESLKNTIYDTFEYYLSDHFSE